MRAGGIGLHCGPGGRLPTSFLPPAPQNHKQTKKVMFFVCRPASNPGFEGVRWFCEAKLVQFVFTVALPFIALMIWQNAVIPAVRGRG
jgi:hypothetical protein